MDHDREITDRADAEDAVTGTCTHCGRPDLFCDCTEEDKRNQQGWD